MSSKNCIYGVKKYGECKKKPGPKSRRKPGPKSRRKPGPKSRRKPGPKSRRKPVLKSRRKRVYMTLVKCKEELREKIKINTKEYNNGKYANRKQAIAVAYSQINRAYPQCKEKL